MAIHFTPKISPMGLCTPTLKREITDELLTLNFHAYLQVIVLLLCKMGYEDIDLSTRTGYVGRNHDGGVDIRCVRCTPEGGRRMVVIQAKQYDPDRQLYQRSIDELRGVTLRESAAEGMLISTGSFSPRISTVAGASAAIAPVRLIDGNLLAEYLALYRVGVNKGSLPAKAELGPYRIDSEFFKQIGKSYSGIARPLKGEYSRTVIVITSASRKRRVT
jgi:restriction endonuclease Mrr